MGYLAQNSATYSKRESCYASNIKRDKKYVNFVCGLGSQIDGWFINPCITPLSAERLAEAICKRWTWDRVKFCTTGSDACEAAVRIARANTGKSIVLQSGYHGFLDWTIGNKVPSCNHIPKQQVMDFDSKSSLLEFLQGQVTPHQIACVIVEPLQLDVTEMDVLPLMRAECKRLGILLIFDEIITGLRVPTGTVASWAHCKPDLIVMGKAAGNGLPISWVAGPKKLMDNPDYFISSTHAGNDYCCNIALQMMFKLSNQVLHLFHKRGVSLFKKINNLLNNTGIHLAGYGTRGEWQSGDLDKLTAFWELMADRGHLLGRAFFLNLRHTDKQLEKLVKDVDWAVTQMTKGYKRKGRCVSFSFRRN